MIPARRVVQRGTFVACDAGFRFRLVSEPEDGELRGTVVFVHAFAEEMNKSRRMVARAARLLAGDGWRVTQRDLLGCGDSSGDFGDATWAAWVHDLDEELAQVVDGRPAWLWCERAGALLAANALSRFPAINLLLWQPVLSGAQHLRQFLRLHAGARIIGSAKAEGGPSPMQALHAGTGVEVGGYRLAPALALPLEQASFDIPMAFAGRIVWLEVSGDEAPALAAPSAALVGQLRERGLAVTVASLQGPPFWQTQEIEECEALLVLTRDALRDDAARPSPSALRARVAESTAAAPAWP